MDFLAGYISGAVGIVVGNPLDVLKVRIQSHGNAKATVGSAGAVVERKRSTLLRGVAAPILTYGALNALLFATYNRTLPLVSGWQSETRQGQPYSYPAHFVSGILAGLATFVVSTPTELIKCRAQLAATTPTTTSAQITRAILQQHGLAGLYHGGVVTALRDGIGYGFYFLAYEASKDFWSAHLATDQVWDQQAKILMCGGLAGVITWASVFPLDVIKSRVQTHGSFLAASQPGPVGQTAVGHASAARGSVTGEGQSLLPREATAPTAETQRSPGAWATAKHAYRTEGVWVFFRGLGVCSVRAFIVNAAQWSVYEVMMGALARG